MVGTPPSPQDSPLPGLPQHCPLCPRLPPSPGPRSSGGDPVFPAPGPCTGKTSSPPFPPRPHLLTGLRRGAQTQTLTRRVSTCWMLGRACHSHELIRLLKQHSGNYDRSPQKPISESLKLIKRDTKVNIYISFSFLNLVYLLNNSYLDLKTLTHSNKIIRN